MGQQTMNYDKRMLLGNGRVRPTEQLIYESYGALNAKKSNAVLICHALSGDHHAAGFYSDEDKQPGWWNSYVGPGKAINTDKFFVVSINNLGGCNGSTGPLTINQETGKPWGADFPTLRVRDWVESQKHLADLLGISRWAAVVGGSLGGMQAMRWATEYPERVRHCAAICL